MIWWKEALKKEVCYPQEAKAPRELVRFDHEPFSELGQIQLVVYDYSTKILPTGETSPMTPRNHSDGCSLTAARGSIRAAIPPSTRNLRVTAYV